MSFERPAPTEHADYYRRYIDLVPDGDVFQTLIHQLGETLALLQRVPPDREQHRYAPDKWSVREVVGHLIDAERVFAYRALTIARSDGARLPGMEQDEWAARSNANERPLDDLGAEWAALRRANVHMLATLGPDAALRRGIASDVEFTVRCFPWIIAGHELWHRQRLEEDYLGGAG